MFCWPTERGIYIVCVCLHTCYLRNIRKTEANRRNQAGLAVFSPWRWTNPALHEQCDRDLCAVLQVLRSSSIEALDFYVNRINSLLVSTTTTTCYETYFRPFPLPTLLQLRDTTTSHSKPPSRHHQNINSKLITQLWRPWEELFSEVIQSINESTYLWVLWGPFLCLCSANKRWIQWLKQF